MPLGQGVHQDARDLLKDMGGIWYLPGEITSCLTGDADEVLGPRQLDKLREGKSSKPHTSKTHKLLTSRLPPAFSSKASRATMKAPTPDDTPVSQISEAPTAGLSDNATTSVEGDPTTVCGHDIIVPGSVPVTATNTSLVSTGPGLKPL